ncbi:antibiotic biosynthesis monooxygenase [Thalassococcus profundi]|uniref:Antibiotic biosynthesis monooxygenase n=1 Tax=Thalassococcus profundi TaxID=2282382 RepID=A0A369TT35_9RHOB|nr:antibiotic biosynthesis monooxygenase [Thalassococcus profundi]RDD67297.1 antibiotic biosynthesis monooxygenase [Thalassococcus profundi]
MGVTLTGTLTCPPERVEDLRAALPDHIRLTRAEPGCEAFDVTETRTGVFSVSERFADRAAFDAHQARAARSPWAEITRGLPRDYTVVEA